MGRKIMQFAASDCRDGQVKLYALAEDGTLWRRYDSERAENARATWVRVPDLPEPTKEETAALKERWAAIS